MEKSSQIAWKLVPLRHFLPLKVVPLIEVLLVNYAQDFAPASFVVAERSYASLSSTMGVGTIHTKPVPETEMRENTMRNTFFSSVEYDCPLHMEFSGFLEANMP
jgi:hypothetical protein